MAKNALEVKSGTLKLPPGASTSDGSLGELRMDGSGNLERWDGAGWVAAAAGSAASDITFDNVASGLTATDVQAAIDEVEGRLDTVETDISNDVEGPVSSTDNAVVRFDGATGQLLQDSGVLVDDTNNVTGVVGLTMTGDLAAVEAATVSLATDNNNKTVYIGTGSGTNTINIGGANTTINMTGTVNTQNVTNLEVSDKLITLNNGGGAASGGTSGIEIEEGGAQAAYVATSGTRDAWEFKAPSSAGVATLTPGAGATNVVLDTVTQTLTNKTIDGDDNTVQDLALTSLKTVLADASKFIVRDASGIPVSNTKAVPTGDVLGTSDAQVVTAKDIDGGSASNTSRLTVPKNDTSTLNGLTRKEATLVYDTTTKTLKVDDGSVLNEIGSGSGSGRVNFLSGDDTSFKNTTGSWAGFDEGAVSAPVDLTGGSPSVLTFARSTAFDSTGGLRITHSAADGQGEGLSIITGTLEAKYQSVTCDIEFTYETSSGYVDDDLQVWIYDVANSALIQPSVYKLKGSLNTPSKFKAQFQTPYNVTTLRLGFFCPNTTATSYTVDVDDVIIGPSVYNYGMPTSDWRSWTPTGSWVTNTTYSGKRRRVGEDEEFEVYVLCSGAPTATGLTINLPVTIDTTKLAHTTFGDGSSAVGIGKVLDSGANSFSVVVSPQSSTSVGVKISNAAGTYVTDAAVTDTVPITFGASDSVHLRFKVPALGYSSAVQMSSEADQRVTTAQYATTAGQSIPDNTETIVDYETKNYDTHAAVTTGASWKFTAPTSGFYKVTASALMAATTSTGIVYLRLFKNGAAYSYFDRRDAHELTTTSGFTIVSGSRSLQLNAGDYIDVRLYQNTGGPLAMATGAGYNLVDVEKVQGPSAIGATELIEARYATGAGQSIANSSTDIIDFGTKTSEDSHGAVTTGASWRFTAPAPGKYSIKFATLHQAAATTFEYRLYKNGSQASTLYRNITSNQNTNNGQDSIRLATGDYIDIRLNNTSGGAIVLNTSTNECYIAIERVGI